MTGKKYFEVKCLTCGKAENNITIRYEPNVMGSQRDGIVAQCTVCKIAAVLGVRA